MDHPYPSIINAITITAPGHAEITQVSLPHPRDDYILVRTTAVGLNPTDWKHIEFSQEASVGARVGCDYAGVVEEVGPAVTKSFARGDRVCGFSHGSNRSQHEDGTFAEYIMVKGDLAIKIPDNLSDEQAATLGVSVSTVGQGLYQALQLPLPISPSPTPIPILIYGGSTATAILGIQFAKLSGCAVATTCSPANAEYVRSLGADAVFDYHSPTCAADIAAWAAHLGGLRLAWDCVATPETAALCASALVKDGDDGGGGGGGGAGGVHYRSLLVIPDEVVKGVNPGASNGFTLAYTIFGEPFEKHAPFPAVPADFEFGKAFWEMSRELLGRGKVEPARTDVNRGGIGLEGVLVGLKELKEGRVSGTKLVYTL